MATDPRILQYPSTELAPLPELGVAFPTYLVDAEGMVYDYVKGAAQFAVVGGLPALAYYEDRDRAQAEGLRIPVVAGWPAYPNQVPGIGVAAGPETEDHQHEGLGSTFAGNTVAYVADDQGQPTQDIAGTADYLSEPLYTTVIIQLLHENRDERDRLHNELRRVLFPLKRALLARSSLIKRVTVDAEKTEYEAGPPASEKPLVFYISLFTVGVYSEMLVPEIITGPDDMIQRIDVEVQPADRAS